MMADRSDVSSAAADSSLSRRVSRDAQAPDEIHRAAKPVRGQPVTYRGEHAGSVIRVEGNLCWVDYATGTDPFIWCFHDGLNKLHDWPSKGTKAAAANLSAKPE